MITYPDCQACECTQDLKTTGIANNNAAGGVLSLL
jgi:hypothetical protein